MHSYSAGGRLTQKRDKAHQGRRHKSSPLFKKPERKQETKMSTIKLNIYKLDNKAEIEKTYSVEGFDIMLGTVEDILDVIDVDKLDDKKEITRMVVKGYKKIKPLLFDIFPGVTEEELRRTKISELITVMVDAAEAAAQSLEVLQKGN
jgi:hypothetical protein